MPVTRAQAGPPGPVPPVSTERMPVPPLRLVSSRHDQDVPDGHQEARHAVETTSPGRGNPPGPPGAVAAAAELPVDPARVPRMPINYSL